MTQYDQSRDAEVLSTAKQQVKQRLLPEATVFMKTRKPERNLTWKFVTCRKEEYKS